MKIVDQTPLQDENGQIGILQRVQGTLKYGLNWYPELQAQKFALARLQRGLAKGYVVVRNAALGTSGIIVPLTLVGPAGIFTIYATTLHGQYQAKGDSWGKLSDTVFKPASINLLTRTERLSRALQAYIERQGVKLPQSVMPILMAANPGMHVESVRPLVRVVMADAIERWAASLGKSPPVLTVETAYELADRIINPRKPKKRGEADEEIAEIPHTGTITADSDDADVAEPLDPNELGFAFEGESEAGVLSPDLAETNLAGSISSESDTKKRFLGMTGQQVVLLGGMFLVEICVLIGFAFIIFQNP